MSWRTRDAVFQTRSVRCGRLCAQLEESARNTCRQLDRPDSKQAQCIVVLEHVQAAESPMDRDPSAI
jgi:hypothetical protein